jgi:asparagine synthase (glutamine-hydrolysing)
MCGIAGIIGKLSDRNRGALAHMNRALAHRGPDAESSYESSPDSTGRGVLFTHRRLSILDLDPRATQPMTDAHTGQVIVFNGEVYNFKELRAPLEFQGHQFQSTGDTAVILRKLAMEGVASLSELRGMYAIAQFDPQFRRVVLARDPLGIKPLYIAINPDKIGDWSLIFASEVRAILASQLLTRPTLSRAAVERYIWNGFVTGPGTIVSQIESLMPGQVLEISSTGESIQITSSTISMPRRDRPTTAADLQHALAKSVELHMLSDVPLGVFLSGGVDSSAMANLAARAGQGQVSTFTLTFNEAELSEARYAKEVADQIKSRHHEMLLSPDIFSQGLERALGTLDQPTFDALNSYFISKAVREAGLTVALVGTGGDELFAGYESFARVPTFLSMSRKYKAVPRVIQKTLARVAARVLAGSAKHVPPQTRYAKLPDLIDAADDPVLAYQINYAMFMPSFVSELVGNKPADDYGLSPVMQSWLRQQVNGQSDLNGVSRLEQRLFLGERLLRDVDMASMAVALETRLPLVDVELLATVEALPDELRFMPLRRKQALRDAGLAGLNPQTFNRPKSGFVMPFESWIRQGLSKQVESALADETLVRRCGLDPKVTKRLWAAYTDGGGKGLSWSRIWGVFVLLRYAQLHDLSVE